MNETRTNTPSVLALYPSARGMAHIFFVAPGTPTNWSLRKIRGDDKNIQALATASELFERYAPQVLVLEETKEKKCKRSPRICALHNAIAKAAKAQGITVVRYTKGAVREYLGVHTKYGTAHAVAERIPALAPRIPPPRKIWMCEDHRQHLFDAAALALMHYATEGYEQLATA